MIKERIGTTPTAGPDGIGFQKASAEMNTLTSTGQPVPGPLKAFVEGVRSGPAPKIDIEAMLKDMEKPNPDLSAAENARNAALAQKARLKLQVEDATQGPPKPDAGIVDPNTFAGLAKFRTIFNTWKYERSLPLTTRNALGHAAEAMGEELQSLADQAGYGKEWQKYQSEYASGQNAIRKAGTLGPRVGKVAGGVVGAIAPTMLPGPARAYAGIAELPSIAAGAKVGGQLGELAEPITRAIVNRPGRPTLRPLPPTPTAYARSVIAQATEDMKNGVISEGEANRRIVRAGGKVKVKPIPTPP